MVRATHVATILALLAVLDGGARAAPRKCAVLDDFSASPAGTFPAGWEVRPPSAKWIYNVRVDGALHFLRATAKKTGIAAGRRVKWDLRVYPVLCWKWRARAFPTGGDESVTGKNDSVLAVYVAFERKWGTLKYHWSERLPVGKELDRGALGRTKMHVQESGAPADRERWVDECVDVEADYRRRYGAQDATLADGVGVLSDADGTSSYAEGDYADFRTCTR